MQQMDEVYRRNADHVYRYLLSLSHDRYVAEELTQETFCQAIRCIDTYDKTCHITTWLCAVAKRQFYAYLRRHPIHESLDTLQSKQTDALSPEQAFLEKSGRIELMRALHKLPDPQREIMFLRLTGELTFREIGEIMGKNENWARVNFYRAKARLREELYDEN